MADDTNDGQQGAILPNEPSDGRGAPFAPPDDVDDDLEDTHPHLDTNVDEHELYDEGKEAITDSEVPDRPDGQDDPMRADEGERIA